MNREVLNKALIFVAGAAIGSVATWKIVKTKYEQLAQEEIEAVRDYYSHETANVVMEAEDSKDDISAVETEVEANPIRTEKKFYGDLVEKLDYTGCAKNNFKEVDDVDKPYVISPDDFDELDDYRVQGLIYFADGVLTDEDNEPIDDVDDLVGVESLTTFGQYEDDAVHVRDDRRKVDYEILRDLRCYSELRPDYVPNKMEG